MFCDKCNNNNKKPHTKLKEPIKCKCQSCGKVFEWSYAEHPNICIDCMKSNIIFKNRCQWCNRQIPMKDTSGFSVTLKGKKRKNKYSIDEL